MKKINNLKTFNRLIGISLLLLIITMVLVIYLDASNNFYLKLKFAQNMQLENWTDIVGAMIGVFSTVGITMFFHNKSEILKLHEEFCNKWDELQFVKHVWREANNDNFLNNLGANFFVVKYSLENVSYAELNEEINKYNLLCRLLDLHDKCTKTKSLISVYFNKNISAEYVSHYLSEQNILIIEKQIKLLQLEKKDINFLNLDELINVSKEYNELFRRLYQFFSELKRLNLSVSDDWKALNEKLYLLLNEYIIDNEVDKILQNDTSEDNIEKLKIHSEFLELAKKQDPIIDNVISWTKVFNIKINSYINEAILKNDYSIVSEYLNIFSKYRSAVDCIDVKVVYEKNLKEGYKIQGIKYKNSLNSNTNSDLLILADREFLNNVSSVYQEIENIITNTSIFERTKIRISKCLSKNNDKI